ncbi:MAG: hypothetical protein V1667_01335 [bacterium]
MNIYKKYIIILFSILIVIAVAVYFFRQAPDLNETEIQNASGDNILFQGLETRPTNEVIQKNPAAYVDIMFDEDHDGLSNEMEKKLGADPKKYDTDEDGLSDSAEILSYYTDPKNPDSDGDGIKDGDENKAGKK